MKGLKPLFSLLLIAVFALASSPGIAAAIDVLASPPADQAVYASTADVATATAMDVSAIEQATATHGVLQMDLSAIGTATTLHAPQSTGHRVELIDFRVDRTTALKRAGPGHLLHRSRALTT